MQTTGLLTLALSANCGSPRSVGVLYEGIDECLNDEAKRLNIAPKSKGWYSIVENGILVVKPRTNKTAAERRAKKNKSSFWTRRAAVV